MTLHVIGKIEGLIRDEKPEEAKVLFDDLPKEVKAAVGENFNLAMTKLNLMVASAKKIGERPQRRTQALTEWKRLFSGS